ncbi:MAG: divalent-cation tolerance protein CutA [Patescibacteria group bacterium]|nr:divalent-cation tolerance protein CutA [Patescibacteria group bacterium]
MKMAVYYLTCANNREADKISKVLLEKRLIACAKKVPASSMFRWKGKIDNAKEIVLMLESVEENFDKINAEVKKLSSYETYILFSIPVSKTTKGVEDWLKKELK